MERRGEAVAVVGDGEDGGCSSRKNIRKRGRKVGASLHVASLYGTLIFFFNI